jgi:hypothetical protein
MALGAVTSRTVIEWGIQGKYISPKVPFWSALLRFGAVSFRQLHPITSGLLSCGTSRKRLHGMLERRRLLAQNARRSMNPLLTTQAQR